MENTPDKPDAQFGTPFARMSTSKKVAFIAKLCVCILTLGMAFPNVMGD